MSHPPSADSVTREAYSHEVISSGFWFGDAILPEPAFYSYTAPEPSALASEPLWPGGAEWLERGDSHLAVYRYELARADEDPQGSILQFLESAYLAGAKLAGWDVDRLASPNGVTAVSRDANPS